MHADLVVLGFDASSGQVAAFAHDRRADRQTTCRGTFLTRSFRLREAFQFDRSRGFAVVCGERTKLQVAHIKLSHYRALLMQAHLPQTDGMPFHAYQHGGRVFGAVQKRGICDNMPTTVGRVGRGKERNANLRLFAMANHSVFERAFPKPPVGWDKRQVEKNVQGARHRLWQLVASFPDLAALNGWQIRHCVAL